MTPLASFICNRHYLKFIYTPSPGALTVPNDGQGDDWDFAWGFGGQIDTTECIFYNKSEWNILGVSCIRSQSWTYWVHLVQLEWNLWATYVFYDTSNAAITLFSWQLHSAVHFCTDTCGAITQYQTGAELLDLGHGYSAFPPKCLKNPCMNF